MPNTLTKWLLSAIRSSSIDSVQDALLDGADPNVLAPNKKLTALQEAILQDNVEIFNLLLDGVTENGITKFPSNRANVNMVGYDFEPCIRLASRKSNLKNKVAMMKTLIESRGLFPEQQLLEFADICSTQLNHSPLREEDFAVMANYVSRLCGTHIGNILNTDNNDDRYMVHLCQYSYAEKSGNELEGWRADEFLPIRIFSLFEILVKLKKGDLLTDQVKVINYEKILSQEILLEIETFKLLQESYVIDEVSDISKTEKEQLYDTLAGVFLERIEKNKGMEFCWAGGYRGHAIYMAFKYTEGKFLIRFDNLGAGIETLDGKPRHMLTDGTVYPKTIAVAFSNKGELKKYVKKLFTIKNEVIPGNDYRKFNGAEREKKRREYEVEREERLKIIYDDNNLLKHKDLLIAKHNLPEQEADTCVATSHQVGLLIRLNDESFYNWVLAEEKRCVFQVNRNKGAKRAHEAIFWEIENKLNFENLFMYAKCCPIDILSEAYKKNLEEIEKTRWELSVFDISRTLLIEIINLAKKITNPVEEHNIANLQVQLGSLIESLDRNNSAKELKKQLNAFRGILYIKQALATEHQLTKYLNFQKAYNCIDRNISSLEASYFLALSAFFIGNHVSAEEIYHMCLKQVEHQMTEINNKKNSDSGLERFIADSTPEKDRPETYLLNIKHKIITSLGFLNISIGNHTEAERCFYNTGKQGVSFKEIPHYFSIEAIFGLGVIYEHRYQKTLDVSKKNGNKDAAIFLFKHSSDSANRNIYHMAYKFLEDLNKETKDSNVKKRDIEKVESLENETSASKLKKLNETPTSIANSQHTFLAKPHTHIVEASADEQLSSEYTANQAASATTFLPTNKQ